MIEDSIAIMLTVGQKAGRIPVATACTWSVAACGSARSVAGVMSVVVACITWD